MSIIILPNYIIDRINAALDAAYLDVPDAAVERDHHYQALVNHFAETGLVAEFSLAKTDAS